MGLLRSGRGGILLRPVFVAGGVRLHHPGARLDQFIGQDKTRLAHVSERQRDLGPVIQPHQAVAVTRTQHDPGKTLAAVDGHVHLGPGEVPREPFPVLGAGQGPVDPGGGHFQCPGTRQRVLDIQYHAHRMTDLFTVLDGDQRAIRTVRHDLHGGGFAPQHRHAHKVKAHVGQRRRDHFGNTGIKARQERQISVQCKKGSLAATPQRKTRDEGIARNIGHAHADRKNYISDRALHFLHLNVLPDHTRDPHYARMTPLNSPPEPARERSERSSSRRLVVVGLIAAVVAGGGLGTGGFMAAREGGSSSQTPPVAAEAGGGGTSDGTHLMLNAPVQNRPDMMGQMPMISPDRAADMLRQTSYSIQQQAEILAALKRRDIILADMPMYDMTGSNAVVNVQSLGLVQTVHLGPQPKSVILPIRVAGNVSITAAGDPGPAGIHAGAVFVPGPTALPVLTRDTEIVIGVVVQ